MFEKLMGGKKKKQADLFSIPEKKYTTDSKAIAKMTSKSLIQLYHDQQKYISVLVQKIEQARLQSQKLTERLDELSEKNEVVNAQISRMTNEHEELAIKYDNLQTSLELFTSQNEGQFRKEMDFLKENEINTEKVKNLGAIFGIFHEKISLLKKIQQQNKSLKNRYAELQEKMEEAEIELGEFEKYKQYNSMLPELLREIQELKQQKEKRKEGEIENHLQKLQQNIMQKVKSQIETVSTMRSEEEETVEAKISNIEFERMKKECSSHQQKILILQQNNGDYLFKIGQYSERIKSLEKQICNSRQYNENLRSSQAKLKDSMKQLSKKVQQDQQKTKQLSLQLVNIGKENQKLKQRVITYENTLKSKVEQCNKYEESLSLLNHQLRIKQQDLKMQKESKVSLENAINGKNNSQVQNLLQIKGKLQREVQQSKKSIDSQKKLSIQSQNKCKQLNQQLQNCKVSLKRLGQEKAIIQESLSNHMKVVEEQKMKLMNELKQVKSINETIKKQSQNMSSKIKSYEEQLRNYSVQTEKLVRTIQTKDNELRKAYGGNEQRQKQKASLLAQINQKQEQAKSRARKYESQLNQQRIKLQALNRKLGIHQTKAEQSKTSLDNMYEQLLGKDKKISQMEIKLKEYKYMIQTLRKQKQDIQNTYEHKLSSMHPDIGSNLSPKIIVQEQIANSSRDKQQIQERELLKNELASLKEQNIAILSENEKLRSEITEIQQLQQSKDKTIKHLQEKRDQMIKQFERMQKNKGKGLAEGSSGFGLMMTNNDSCSKIQNMGQGRDKRIASKALKGFEIMLKLQHQLYKKFVSVFGQQMEEEQIKGLQKQINAIIKKSCDMKDVFEGYLD